MTHIMKMYWDMNSEKLRKVLAERTDLNSCNYKDLVKLTFDTIYNSDEGHMNYYKLNTDAITEIDDGGYQGTLLFTIPFHTYQPGASEYIMTFIEYGSCSGCDSLQAAQDWHSDKLTEEQIKDFMVICKDLVCNSIKPFNYGWRADERWNVVKEKENEEFYF